MQVDSGGREVSETISFLDGCGVEGHATYRLLDRSVTRESGGVNSASRQPDSRQAGTQARPAVFFARNEQVDPTHELERTDKVVPCQCGGAMDRVDCTTEEMQQYNCGKSWECCARAFVCRICKKREACSAPSPEVEY